MSASLVRKSLALIDDTYHNPADKKKRKHAFDPRQRHQLVTGEVKRKGRKVKVHLLKDGKKLTISEAKRTYKSKEKIAEENREKLRLIREASAVDLDEKITSQLFERAVTRRPVKLQQAKKDESTAFTEEDFKKFEEEYFDEAL